MCYFYSHVTQSTQTYYSNSLSGTCFPMHERRIHSDTSTEEGRCTIHRKVVRNLKDVIFIYYDFVGITSLSSSFSIFFNSVVCQIWSLHAILFHSFKTSGALSARVDKTANAHSVIHFVAFHFCSNCRNYTCDLMSWNHRIV